MTTEETNVALFNEVKRLRGQVQLLRGALVMVVGTDSRKLLELMRRVTTTSPVFCEKDAEALQAIDALLATMP